MQQATLLLMQTPPYGADGVRAAFHTAAIVDAARLLQLSWTSPIVLLLE